MRRILLVAAAILILTPAPARRKRPNPAPPVKVACVGNSITYGMKLENRERDSYPAQLQELLGSAYEVGNFGKSGATLLRQGHRPYMEQEEFRQAMAFAGDIVVIHLGVNDTDPRNWPHLGDRFAADYLALIDSLRHANPKARFFLARMTPIGSNHPRFLSGTRDWHGKIQKPMRRVSGSSTFSSPCTPSPGCSLMRFTPTPRVPLSWPAAFTGPSPEISAAFRCRPFILTIWCCPGKKSSA